VFVTTPNKPSAETISATKPSESGATLHGVVSPNGAETKYYFEYGTTESYGTKTAEVSAGAGTGYAEVTNVLTGLTANTKYDFRIVATNSHGTTDGANEKFYTAPVTGEAEFKPIPTKKKFTSTSGADRWMLPGEGGSLECSKSTSSGEITSATTLGKVVMQSTGCKLTIGDETCPMKSEGGGTEEIVTTSLKGELGIVATTEAASGIGLLLKPETGEVWTSLVETKCLGGSTVEGSLAGEVTSLSKQTTHGLDFVTSEYGAKQRIKEITLDSGELKKPKWDGFLTVMTLEQSNEVKFEEALEIT
jgi:hypothetical protein